MPVVKSQPSPGEGLVRGAGSGPAPVKGKRLISAFSEDAPIVLSKIRVRRCVSHAYCFL